MGYSGPRSPLGFVFPDLAEGAFRAGAWPRADAGAVVAD